MLFSERLSYQKLTRADLSNYLSWSTSDACMKFISGKGLSVKAGTERFEKGLKLSNLYQEVGLYMVYLKGTGTYVGVAKLVYLNATEAEVGYGLLPPYWGKGYASEILVSMIEYAGTLSRIQTLIGIVNPLHDASIHVLTKQGFVFDKNGGLDGKTVSHYILANNLTNTST